MRPKVNTRQCIACKNKIDKSSLIRFTIVNGKVVVDKEGKMQGRAVYVCADDKCIEEMLKKKALNRAFRKNLTDEEINEIKNILK